MKGIEQPPEFHPEGVVFVHTLMLLEQLRDPSAIEEHLRRLDATGDGDPPLAISSAKAIVEATCKHVLDELNEPWDERADVPTLVKAVQRALKVHPETIAPTLPVLFHDLPSGAPRIKQKTDGIKATIVNGQVLMRDNEHTGAYPGQLLRGPLAHN